MLAGRKFKNKTLAILVVVSLFIMLIPGVSLGDDTTTTATATTFTQIVFNSQADQNLTSGSISSTHFKLQDNSGNLYANAINAYLVDSNGTVLTSAFSMVPDTSNLYIFSLASTNLGIGVYTLKVTDTTNTLQQSAQIYVTQTNNIGNVHIGSGYMTFVAATDQSLITGVAKTINYRLYDSTGAQFSGSVTAYIQDSKGATTSYSATSTSLSNLTIDKPGTYTLIIYSNTLSVYGTLTVSDPKLTMSGSLIVNNYCTVTGTLTDAFGAPIDRQAITVDSTDVGGSSASYTTLYDGTFKLTMTPTTTGTVKITLGGHTVGTIPVNAAYTSGSRIGGASTDNATLSVFVAQQGWKSANSVILTRDDVVADAMVAAPLSKKLDAPILMTPTDSLNSDVLTEIQALKAKTVYIIGGTGAVSSAVADALSSNGLANVRIAGDDRYDTAAKIAAQIGSSGTVYLAYGYGEPDALAAGPLAAEQGIPILLTDTNSLPATTVNALASLRPVNIDLLGGTGVISSDLEGQLSGKYSVQRWGGVDRYATEQIILQNFFNLKSATNQYPLYIASAYVSPSDVSNGKPYADALLTAALAAKKNGFMITLPPNTIPNSISTFLLFNKVYIPSASVVGNSSAISNNLEQLIQSGLAH